MNKEQLIKNIASLADKWEGLTIEKQEDKVFEEYNELLEAKKLGDVEEIKKELADVLITMVVLSKLQNGFGIQGEWVEVVDYIQTGVGVYCSFTDTVSSYIVVKLNKTARQYNLNVWGCLEHKYNIVAKREGKVINGTFVKKENHGK